MRQFFILKTTQLIVGWESYLASQWLLFNKVAPRWDNVNAPLAGWLEHLPPNVRCNQIWKSVLTQKRQKCFPPHSKGIDSCDVTKLAPLFTTTSKKMVNDRPLFRLFLFSVFSNKQYKIYKKSLLKNVQTVSGDRIRTHNLLSMSLLP